MDITISDSQAEELIFAADTIYRVINFAKGQADRYIARRGEIQVLQFSDFAKKSPYGRRQGGKNRNTK